ncbi:hypothetical protein SAMN04490248_11416 [Salinihabitans flavidus]|uniref:Uncharacterized protein n=1 Tax=Salinihabitans flavidus TaxID=569882 RepID=A0A1H8T2I0_9RHOB|nr:hypothetical protein SAMN04490248_11416 [Salinihabitans flavidus]
MWQTVLLAYRCSKFQGERLASWLCRIGLGHPRERSFDGAELSDGTGRERSLIGPRSNGSSGPDRTTGSAEPQRPSREAWQPRPPRIPPLTRPRFAHYPRWAPTLTPWSRYPEFASAFQFHLPPGCGHLTVSIGHSSQPMRLNSSNAQIATFAKLRVMVALPDATGPCQSFIASPTAAAQPSLCGHLCLAQHLKRLRGSSAQGAYLYPMMLARFTDPIGRRRQGWHRGCSYRGKVLGSNALQLLI